MLYMSALFLYTKDKIIYALKISTLSTNESADPKALINKGDLLLTKECADPVRAQLNKRNAVHNFIDPVFPPSGAPPVGHKAGVLSHTQGLYFVTLLGRVSPSGDGVLSHSLPFGGSRTVVRQGFKPMIFWVLPSAVALGWVQWHCRAGKGYNPMNLMHSVARTSAVVVSCVLTSATVSI